MPVYSCPCPEVGVFFMKYSSENERFMAKAISLARRGIGYTSPNPAVGCVIIKDGEIIAGDYHRRAGKPHAEALALAKAGKKSRGATLCVTLEPCCVFGKTPPCTEAIIEAGIKKVVIGSIDPNPKMDGKGIKRLKEMGIKVETGILQEKCHEINPAYNKFITTGLPLVTIKYAQSLDGRIATRTGHSQWISSPDSLKLAHKLRASHDAIMVGANTANIDDPQLTVRHLKGRNPVRLVITKSGKLKKNLRFLQENTAPTLIITSKTGEQNIRKYVNEHVDYLTVPLKGDSFDLRKLLNKLASRCITSILIEGGAGLITSFIKQKMADKIVIISAPIFIGDGLNAIGDLGIKKLDTAITLVNIKQTKYGRDCAMMGDIA